MRGDPHRRLKRGYPRPPGVVAGPLFRADVRAPPVDYLAIRSDLGGTDAVGEACSGAADASACADALDAPSPSDPRVSGPGGGAPAPREHIVYTRGDEVGAVGRFELAAFLAPVDTPADAASLARVQTDARRAQRNEGDPHAAPPARQPRAPPLWSGDGAPRPAARAAPRLRRAARSLG